MFNREYFFRSSYLECNLGNSFNRTPIQPPPLALFWHLAHLHITSKFIGTTVTCFYAFLFCTLLFYSSLETLSKYGLILVFLISDVILCILQCFPVISDCCAQQRTYEKFYGLMAQRLCQLNRSYIEPFQKIFIDSYNTVHRLEIGKLRNVAKIFAHLLFTDAMSWLVLSAIKLNENDTTSSSRIFIKLLFQVKQSKCNECNLVR